MTFGTRQHGAGFRPLAALRQWVKGWLSGGPHFVIGDHYLHRWYVIPRNPWLNVYLHKFLHDDEDRALHDHPWWFISVMLWGGYYEHTNIMGQGLTRRTTGSVAFRPAIHTHRVELLRRADGSMRFAWTLVVTGHVVRNWGFHCPQGFVRWQDFLIPDDYGKTGRGCGEHGTKN